MINYNDTIERRDKDVKYSQFEAPLGKQHIDIATSELVKDLYKNNVDIYETYLQLVQSFNDNREVTKGIEVPLSIVFSALRRIEYGMDKLINHSWWLCQYYNVQEDNVRRYIEAFITETGLGGNEYYSPENTSEMLYRLADLLNRSEIDYQQFYRVKMGERNVNIQNGYNIVESMLYKQIHITQTLLQTPEDRQTLTVDNLITTYRIIEHIGIRV